MGSYERPLKASRAGSAEYARSWMGPHSGAPRAVDPVAAPHTTLLVYSAVIAPQNNLSFFLVLFFAPNGIGQCQ